MKGNNSLWQFSAIKLALGFVAVLSLSGCKELSTCFVLGGNYCNFSSTPADAVVDPRAVMVGDSGFDFGDGCTSSDRKANRYNKQCTNVPHHISKVTGKHFMDFSVSNSTTDQIYTKQVLPLKKAGSQFVNIEAAIATGISNNLLKPCSQTKEQVAVRDQFGNIVMENGAPKTVEQTVNTSLETLNRKCITELAHALGDYDTYGKGHDLITGLPYTVTKDSSRKSINSILQEFANPVSFPRLTHIFWMGPVANDPSKLSQEILDYLNMRTKAACESVSKCHYVDVSTLFSIEQVATCMPKYIRNWHATNWSACKLASRIVGEMRTNGGASWADIPYSSWADCSQALADMRYQNILDGRAAQDQCMHVD